MTFLKAKWQNLIMVNYEVNPEILKPYIPLGTELDFYNNKCYISLVGFMFKDTKVLGLKLPYHINFEEVNLRFYVKHNDKRGVVFIKEIVPKPIITYIANTIYHEHYITHKMSHINNKEANHYLYQWQLNGINQQLSVNTLDIAIPIKENSEAEFIAEHYYGYTKHKNKTFEYEVKHPKWLQKEVIDYNIDVDFTANYGKAFSVLKNKKPSSVFLAVGSEITVSNKHLINHNL